MAVRVEKRMARARSFFSTDRLTMLTPTISLRRVRVIPRSSNSSSSRQWMPVSSSSTVIALSQLRQLAARARRRRPFAAVRSRASDESFRVALQALAVAECCGHRGEGEPEEQRPEVEGQGERRLGKAGGEFE